MEKEEILLNLIAQEKAEMEEGLSLYDSIQSEDQNSLFKILAFYLFQSSPSKESIIQGISKSSVKENSSMISLLSNNTIGNLKRKIYNISSVKERRTLFILMLYVFKEADTYRRNTFCKNGCNHKWHNINK